MNKHIFRQNLVNLRKSKGLKQKELAAILKIKRPCYAAYEEGRQLPPTAVQIRIAEYFEYNLHTLLTVLLPISEPV